MVQDEISPGYVSPQELRCVQYRRRRSAENAHQGATPVRALCLMLIWGLVPPVCNEDE